MLDYKFIKDNLDAVKQNIINRNMTADADKVVELGSQPLAFISKCVVRWLCASANLCQRIAEHVGKFSQQITSAKRHQQCRCSLSAFLVYRPLQPFTLQHHFVNLWLQVRIGIFFTSALAHHIVQVPAVADFNA